MEKFQKDIPDVLISDIAMPGEDGYALLKHVKEWEKEHNRRIPAIAVTAYVSDQDVQRALVEGFAAHLGKPVEPSRLITTIMAVTGRRESISS